MNHDAVTRRIPNILEKSKSITQIGKAGRSVVCSTWALSSEYFPRTELFTNIDKIMVKLCNSRDGVEGLNRENIEKWQELRIEMIESSASQNTTRDQPTLPDDYFDTQNGLLVFLE